MNNTQKVFSTLLSMVPILAIAGGGALKSGLPVGGMVSAFEPTHVSGPDAGTKTCPVCKYGATPAVQVWVNDDRMENISKIADTLEASIKKEGSDKLKAFIIYVKPANVSAGELSKKLKMMAQKCRLQNVGVLYVDAAATPALKQYRINLSNQVKNTVLVYHAMKVDANFVNLKADSAGINSLKMAMMKACGM